MHQSVRRRHLGHTPPDVIRSYVTLSFFLGLQKLPCSGSNPRPMYLYILTWLLSPSYFFVDNQLESTQSSGIFDNVTREKRRKKGRRDASCKLATPKRFRNLAEHTTAMAVSVSEPPKLRSIFSFHY